jgi:threonine/homoserine/homoserine lactone efflux protein
MCQEAQTRRPMKYLELVFLVYIMGFLAAIPMGATQVEIAKRVLGGYLLPAFMVMLGAVSSDMMYGAMAVFGIVHFLQNQIVRISFWLVSAMLLLVLGVLTIRDSSQPTPAWVSTTVLRSKRLSYITGSSLAATNPMMILWWLFGLHFVEELNLVNAFTPSVSITFLLVGGLGLSSYLTLFVWVLHHTKKLIPATLQQRIRFWLGGGLLVLAGYFFFKSIQALASL